MQTCELWENNVKCILFQHQGEILAWSAESRGQREQYQTLIRAQQKVLFCTSVILCEDIVKVQFLCCDLLRFQIKLAVGHHLHPGREIESLRIGNMWDDREHKFRSQIFFCSKKILVVITLQSIIGFAADIWVNPMNQLLMVLIFDSKPFHPILFRNYINAFTPNSPLSVFIKLGQQQDQRKLLTLNFFLYNDLVTKIKIKILKSFNHFFEPGYSGLQLDQDNHLDKG